MKGRWTGPLLGRRAELEHGERSLAAARGGRAGLLLIEGDAGIGKTALVHEIAACARRAGWATALGHCLDVHGDLPYAPLRGVLRDLATSGHLGDDPGAPRPSLARLVPAARHRRSGAAAQRAHGDLHDLLGELLDAVGAVAHDAPLLLVVEDAHWADTSTLDLLTALAHDLSGERVLVIVTARTGEPGGGRHRDLFATVERLPGTTRMALGGLGAAAVRAYVRSLTGDEPTEHGLASMMDRSGGNPLHVAELVSGAAGAVPPSITTATMGRLSLLDEVAARVVRDAAVLGPVMPVGVLDELAGLHPDELRRALRRAETVGLLVRAPDGEVRFRHALFQEAVYADLVPQERTLLHARAAAVVERRRELVGDEAATAAAAYHYDRAEMAEPALVTALHAAEAARRQLGFAEAYQHLARAVRRWDAVADPVAVTGRDRVDLLVDTADAAGDAGFDDAALELLEEAAQLVDADRDAHRWTGVAQRLCDLHWRLGQGDVARARFDDLTARLASVRHAASRAAVQVRRAAFLADVGALEQAGAAAGEGLSLARSLADAGLEKRAATVAGQVASLAGDPAGLGLLRSAVTRGHRGEPRGAARAHTVLAGELLRLARLAEAEDVASAGLALAREADLAQAYQLPLLRQLADVLVERGRWPAADQLLGEAPRRAWGRERVRLDLARARLATRRGRLDEADEWLARVEPERGGSAVAAHAALLRAEVALARGDAPRALASLAPQLAVTVPHPGSPALAACAAALAAAEAAGADARPLRRLARARVRELASTPSAPLDGAAWAAVITARSAERPAEQVRAWSGAAEAFDGCGMPFQAAAARCRQAHVAVAAGGLRTEAAAAADAALQAARALGAVLLEQEVESLARRAALPLASITPGPTASALGLTPRELEVLAHVAGGRSNPDIAAALYISPKTASVHVSNILRKLGVANRVEAATFAHRNGLLVDRAGGPAPPRP
ncbi:MAG TPA: AAA family ATPase [Acidimicrobiales bacterium]